MYYCNMYLQTRVYRQDLSLFRAGSRCSPPPPPPSVSLVLTSLSLARSLGTNSIRFGLVDFWFGFGTGYGSGRIGLVRIPWSPPFLRSFRSFMYHERPNSMQTCCMCLARRRSATCADRARRDPPRPGCRERSTARGAGRSQHDGPAHEAEEDGDHGEAQDGDQQGAVRSLFPSFAWPAVNSVDTYRAQP